jgi:hypothetical protein
MLANVPLTIAGTTSIENQRAGLAAGLLNTSMQLGGACGLGVIAVVVTSLSNPGAGSPDAAALQTGLWVCLVGFCLPALMVVVLGRPQKTIPAHRGPSTAAKSPAEG